MTGAEGPGSEPGSSVTLANDGGCSGRVFFTRFDPGSFDCRRRSCGTQGMSRLTQRLHGLILSHRTVTHGANKDCSAARAGTSNAGSWSMDPPACGTHNQKTMAPLHTFGLFAADARVPYRTWGRVLWGARRLLRRGGGRDFSQHQTTRLVWTQYTAILHKPSKKETKVEDTASKRHLPMSIGCVCSASCSSPPLGHLRSQRVRPQKSHDKETSGSL